jgi:hypothetical protein
MARTRTLTQLRDDVRKQFDLESMTARHPNANLDRAINQSIQQLRELVSDAGNPYFLRHTTGTLSAGATSPYHFGALTVSALSPAFLRPYGFDIKVGTLWTSLEPVNFEQRNDNQGDWLTGGTTGQPRVFFLFNASQIAYAPAPDRAYVYELYDLPAHTDLSGDSDTFDGIAGWEEWVVFNAGSKLLLRDAQPEQFAAFAAERDRLLAGILARSNHRQRAGATRRADVRGRNRAANSARFRWGV